MTAIHRTTIQKLLVELPAQCVGARKAVISGKPDFKHISTSHIERPDSSNFAHHVCDGGWDF
jgi:hypothetical protein